MKLKENRLYLEIGKILLVVLPLVFLMPFVFQLDASGDKALGVGQTITCQPYTIPGVDMKNNLGTVSVAFENIKKANGVLVMGTSETGYFPDDNYFGILNSDANVKEEFTMLNGAGRNGYLYFPLMLENPEAFKNLRALYFINPIYWVGGLNAFHNDYFVRYNSAELTNRAIRKSKEEGLYDDYLSNAVYENTDWSDKLNNKLDYCRSYFFTDLPFMVNALSSPEHEEKLVCLETQKRPINYKDSSVLKSLEKGLNMNLNISYSYEKKHDSDIKGVDTTSNFQYQALRDFISFEKKLGMNITYLLGPYNGVYVQHFVPHKLKHFREVTEKVKAILDEEGVDYVDASDLSHQHGIFLDEMHHSKLGAWKIAEKLSKHYGQD